MSSAGSSPIIETARLILRPWAVGDAAALLAATRSLGESPLVGWKPSVDIHDSRRIIKDVLAVPENYAITVKGFARSARPVGSIGLTRVSDAGDSSANEEFKLGFWIAKPFTGMGYMTEAVVALLRHAFVDLNAQTIWCGYYEGNISVERAQIAAGFTRHGQAESKSLPAVGDIVSRYLTRITREEWTRGQGNDPTDISYVVNQREEATDLIGNIPMVAMIRSGGQTGADRGALDAAREAGIPICGWCPANGLAEDSSEGHTLLDSYPELVPTLSAGYVQRTAWNVRDAHATLIVAPDGLEPGSGTEMTVRFAKAYSRPVLVVKSIDDIDDVVPWLQGIGTGLTLNVAGPRESKLPGVYNATKLLIAALLGGELG